MKCANNAWWFGKFAKITLKPLASNDIILFFWMKTMKKEEIDGRIVLWNKFFLGGGGVEQLGRVQREIVLIRIARTK
jgi:hypothetical protein